MAIEVGLTEIIIGLNTFLLGSIHLLYRADIKELKANMKALVETQHEKVDERLCEERMSNRDGSCEASCNDNDREHKIMWNCIKYHKHDEKDGLVKNIPAGNAE